MKNKKVLGIIISAIGAVISVSTFIYTSTLNIDIPTNGYRTGFEVLLLQFNESKMLIPFIIGIVLFAVGVVIFLIEAYKKKK